MIDPYVYPGTNVLINHFGIKDKPLLEQVEKTIFIAIEKTDIPRGNFDFEHFKAIHKTFFQEIYPFAGQIRTVDLSKDDTKFCHNGFIESEARKLFSSLKNEDYLKNTLSSNELVTKLAHYFSEINAIHPFREGNGRTNREFITQLAEINNHTLDFTKMSRNEYIQASIDGWHGNNSRLENLFSRALYLNPINNPQLNNQLNITNNTTVNEVLNFFKNIDSKLIEGISLNNSIDYRGHQVSLDFIKPRDLANCLNQKCDNTVKIEFNMERGRNKEIER